MRVRPLGDRVVLKRFKAEETTRGGIIIPDTAKGTIPEAEVVAVSQGKVEGERAELQVGDRVLFEEHQATEIEVDGKVWLLIREEHVMAILK